MQVFRVENSACLGPYNDHHHDTGPYTSSIYKAKEDAQLDKQTYLDSELPPWEDGIDRHTPLHRFGFASLDQLLAWFPPMVLDLLERKYGHRIVVYEVAQYNVIFGRSQVAFLWHEATKVMTL